MHKNKMEIKQRIKIFWLHPHFLNWMGGHKYIYEIIRRLAKKYDVVVVADAFSNSSIKKFKALNIKIKKLSGYSTNNYIYWLILPFFIAKDVVVLKKMMKKDDVIVASMFPMNVIALLLNERFVQLCYEPYVFFFDENFIRGFPTYLYQRILIKISKFCYSWLDILATRKANVVLTLSEFNRRWIRKVYKKDSVAVYEGVDTSFFKNTPNMGLESKYKHNRVIFHSTDFTKIKGTEFIFKAMPYVKTKIPNLRLLISSTLVNDKEKKKLIEYSKKMGFHKNIEFLGFLDYKLLPSYLSLANVVIQPSVGQSMNLTVKEAMACGTAVITSLEGKEQFVEGTAGFLVNPRNSKKLADTIIKIINNKTLAMKMGEKGVNVIKERFSWQAVYKRIEEQIGLFLRNE